MKRHLMALVGVAAISIIASPAFAQCAKMAPSACAQCKMAKNLRLSPDQANASCAKAADRRASKPIQVKGSGPARMR